MIAASAGAREAGVSLVELLVAAAIGMLLLLGAGRLYLGSIDNLAEVEALSDRQQGVMLGAVILLREIRQGGVAPGRYRLVETPDAEGCSLFDSEAAQPLIAGLAPTAASCAASQPIQSSVEGREGLYRVQLRGLSQPAPVILHGMDRRAAVWQTDRVVP